MNENKYHSLEVNINVGKKNNEHQPKQPRQKDYLSHGKARKAKNSGQGVSQRPTSQLCATEKDERKTFNPAVKGTLKPTQSKMYFKVLSQATSMDEKNFMCGVKGEKASHFESFVPVKKFSAKNKESKRQISLFAVLPIVANECILAVNRSINQSQKSSQKENEFK